MDKVIKVSNLYKDYVFSDSSRTLLKRIFDDRKIRIEAIKNVNFEIKRGETVGILGLNGAGKSTLIKILTGIILPTSGKINVLGFNPSEDRYNYSYNIGVVMGQKSLLWNNIAVIESLKLYKNIYDIKDEAFYERLNLFDEVFKINDLIKKPVRKLSLGERMKCEIVASLIHNPKILFLDEPTIGLDLIAKRQIHKMLVKMNKMLNCTIILTTHNLNDMEIICDRIILLNKGIKIFDDKKEKLMLSDDKRIINVTLEKMDESNLLEELGYKKISHNKYSIEVNKNNLSFNLEKISKFKAISDINIESKNLEDLIYEIYEEKDYA